MYSKIFIVCNLLVCISCHSGDGYSSHFKKDVITPAGQGEEANNPYPFIRDVPMPAGFTRIKKDTGSFSAWLLDIKLKKDKTVYQFNGKPKVNQTAQFAVLDISVGDKDLQQCADAVMRLRAEYLFAAKKYAAIHFPDNAGTIYQFHQPYTRQQLLMFLQRVFGMCGTASLAKQLIPVSIKKIEPGDVLIRGGFPGHAVIVMDVAINQRGKKIFLLAQSYMPAQDIHLLVNPVNNNLSPWYEVNEHDLVETPEYTFKKEELKRW